MHSGGPLPTTPDAHREHRLVRGEDRPPRSQPRQATTALTSRYTQVIDRKRLETIDRLVVWFSLKNLKNRDTASGS